mmetsp:Transcript_10849/g.46249  ORF Transcript_10849/g.46249 Transcript_10849/m.46249 type:complete len:214 (-) Transcript_10849:2111-2752(-)
MDLPQRSQHVPPDVRVHHRDPTSVHEQRHPSRAHRRHAAEDHLRGGDLRAHGVHHRRAHGHGRRGERGGRRVHEDDGRAELLDARAQLPHGPAVPAARLFAVQEGRRGGLDHVARAPGAHEGALSYAADGGGRPAQQGGPEAGAAVQELQVADPDARHHGCHVHDAGRHGGGQPRGRDRRPPVRARPRVPHLGGTRRDERRGVWEGVFARRRL